MIKLTQQITLFAVTRGAHAGVRVLAGVVLALMAPACSDPAPGTEPASGPVPAPTSVVQEARQAVAEGDWDAARRLLETAVITLPEDEGAWLALGQLQAQTGQVVGAAQAYVHLADLRPANGIYALQAGSYLEASRRPQAAAAYLARAHDLRPRDPDAAYRYGLHLFHAGDNEAAISVLERGVSLAPARPDVVLKLAQAMGRLGRFDDARQVLDTALDRQPDAPLLTFQRGLMEARSGDPQAAVTDFTRVLELDPEQHRARYALARALMASDQEEEGRRQMEKFAAGEEDRRQQETTRLVAHLARAGSQDDPVARRQRLQDLVLSDPTDAGAHQLLARAHADEGDYQQAAAACERALRLDPALEDCIRLRTEMLRRLGLRQEAGTP